MFTLCQCSVPLAKAFESLGAHRDGQKWLCQRDLCFCYSNKCLGNQLKRKKDFFCFMLSEVVLDGLSSIAFGPVVRHYNVARVCVEKTCLPRGIQGRRKRQGPNIPLQDMPLGTSLLLPGPYHPFKVTLPTLNFPYHHRLVTEPLNTHAFGGHLVKLQQSLSLGMVCLCGFQVTACQIPFLLRQ